MHEAEKFALQNFDDAQYLVWLNDDSFLVRDAFSRIRKLHESHPGAVIVGSMSDTEGALTYGGLVGLGRSRPLAYRLVQPDPVSPLLVQTLNGNFVVTSVKTAIEIGGIQGGYTHAFADIDYGIRATQKGMEVILAPGFFGICERNPEPGRQTLAKSWRSFTSVKGGGNYNNLRLLLGLKKPLTWRFWLVVNRLTWFVKFMSDILGKKVKN